MEFGRVELMSARRSLALVAFILRALCQHLGAELVVMVPKFMETS